MPAPPARQRSTSIPWGTSSTSIFPLAICSSLAVGVPGRTENAAISFFTWLFSARIWPRVAPGSPSELQTSVRFFVPLSRRASIRLLAKRCPTLKPAIATVAPSLTSATACWGDATVLSMALLSINRDGVRSRYLIQFAGRPARRLCDSLPRCQTSWLPASVPHSSPLSSKDLRIDYVDRLALQPRHQPGDRAAVDALVTLLLAVAEVRSADD